MNEQITDYYSRKVYVIITLFFKFILETSIFCVFQARGFEHNEFLEDFGPGYQGPGITKVGITNHKQHFP